MSSFQAVVTGARPLVRSLCITNSHSKCYVLAVTYWRHNKNEKRTSKPFTANRRNYSANKTDNYCDKCGGPGESHRQHCSRSTALRYVLRWHSTRGTSALRCFISLTASIANRHNVIQGR